jgi:hypothetical protein
MGDQNCTSVWQRAAELMFRPLLQSQRAGLLLDDLVGGTDTKEEMLTCARDIARCCVKFNLRLKPGKCRFGLSRISCLGFVIDKNGKHAHPAKVETITGLPIPQNKKQLLTFLGKAGFYRCLIPFYTRNTRKLSALLKSGDWEPGEWTDEHTVQFNWVKSQLMHDPVMRVFNPDHEVFIYTDACETGLGGVFCQRDPDDDKIYMVDAWSRVLHGAEANYNMTELECLAVKCCLEKWQKWLPANFNLCTDSRNVRWLFKKDFEDVGDLSPENKRTKRWVLQLQEYAQRMTIVHIPGWRNPADAPSRRFESNKEGDAVRETAKSSAGVFPFKVIDTGAGAVYRARDGKLEVMKPTVAAHWVETTELSVTDTSYSEYSDVITLVEENALVKAHAAGAKYSDSKTRRYACSKCRDNK